MIINKVSDFWTDEDKARLAQIEQEQDNLYQSLELSRNETDSGNANFIKQYGDLEEEASRLKLEVEDRYIKATPKKKILEDVEDIVAHIEQQDFLDDISYRVEILASLRSERASEASLEILKEYATENFANCYEFILKYLRVQLNALGDEETSTDKVKNIVRKRVALWYVEEKPAYYPMVHSKATDALAFMNTRNAKIDKITGTAIVNRFDVELAILKLKDLRLGINTDKLLSVAIATFTRQNDFRHNKINPDIVIDLKEYANLLGYDVEEHSKDTPEETKLEKKRAKNQLDNARKAIQKNLDILHASTLTWTDTVNKQTKDYMRVSLVTATGITNGKIHISLSPQLAQYLADKRLITQYPVKLLAIDSRQPTAYYIGRKLAEHYNMDNNIIKGTNNRISIPTLLATTDLPSYKEVQEKDRGHWAERIKEPFERALDVLTKEGILKSWEYTHAKGVPLSDEEAQNITSYASFSKLYLLFTPSDKIYHADRIGARIEARKEEEAKETKRKRNTGKKK